MGAVSLCVCMRVRVRDTEKELVCALRARDWGGSVMQAVLSMHVDWKMCGSCGWLSPVSLPLKNSCQEKCLLYRLWLPDAGDNG